MAGCQFAYLPELGGHVPLYNERMQTTLEGLYVAGNITGIESAQVVIAQGRVAGLSIAADYGKLGENELLNEAMEKVEAVRQAAAIQFHPDIKQGRLTVSSLFRGRQTYGLYNLLFKNALSPTTLAEDLFCKLYPIYFEP